MFSMFRSAVKHAPPTSHFGDTESDSEQKSDKIENNTDGVASNATSSKSQPTVSLRSGTESRVDAVHQELINLLRTRADDLKDLKPPHNTEVPILEKDWKDGNITDAFYLQYLKDALGIAPMARSRKTLRTPVGVGKSSNTEPTHADLKIFDKANKSYAAMQLPGMDKAEFLNTKSRYEAHRKRYFDKQQNPLTYGCFLLREQNKLDTTGHVVSSESENATDEEDSTEKVQPAYSLTALPDEKMHDLLDLHRRHVRFCTKNNKTPQSFENFAQQILIEENYVQTSHPLLREVLENPFKPIESVVSPKFKLRHSDAHYRKAHKELEIEGRKTNKVIPTYENFLKEVRAYEEGGREAPQISSYFDFDKKYNFHFRFVRPHYEKSYLEYTSATTRQKMIPVSFDDFMIHIRTQEQNGDEFTFPLPTVQFGAPLQFADEKVSQTNKKTKYSDWKAEAEKHMPNKQSLNGTFVPPKFKQTKPVPTLKINDQPINSTMRNVSRDPTPAGSPTRRKFIDDFMQKKRYWQSVFPIDDEYVRDVFHQWLIDTDVVPGTSIKERYHAFRQDVGLPQKIIHDLNDQYYTLDFPEHTEDLDVSNISEKGSSVHFEDEPENSQCKTR